MAGKFVASTLIKLAIASSVPASLSLAYHPDATTSPEIAPERPVIIDVEDPASQYPQSADGYYYATATADGHAIKMLIDSGANITVLSARDARAIGLTPPRSAFRERLVTANGTVRIALVKVAHLTLARKDFTEVQVAVTADDRTPSLCGSDLLSRFRSVAISDAVLQLSA